MWTETLKSIEAISAAEYHKPNIVLHLDTFFLASQYKQILVGILAAVSGG